MTTAFKSVQQTGKSEPIQGNPFKPFGLIWVMHYSHMGKGFDAYGPGRSKCESCGAQHKALWHIDVPNQSVERIGQDIPRCDCASRKRMHDAVLSRSILASRYQRMTIESYSGSENEYARGAAADYAEEFTPLTSKGVMFVGPVGTGKTHLAAAICNALMERLGTYCILHSVPELVYRIKNNGFNIDPLLDCDLLVLDDLGSERVTEFVVDTLFVVINSRIANDRPMLITTNLDGNDLAARYGDEGRIIDRLVGACQMVQVNGKSKRGQI